MSWMSLVTSSHRKQCSPLWVSLLLLLIPGFTGCSGQRSESEFIPSERTSHDAIVTALEAWKAGQATGPVPGTTPVIHVTDSSRGSGQTLKAFEILGEVPGNAPQCFLVRLVLENPSEERRERFVVFGIDPLWVFRHEDYDMLLHWEHPIPKEPATTVSGSDAAASPKVDSVKGSKTE